MSDAGRVQCRALLLTWRRSESTKLRSAAPRLDTGIVGAQPGANDEFKFQVLGEDRPAFTAYIALAAEKPQLARGCYWSRRLPSLRTRTPVTVRPGESG